MRSSVARGPNRRRPSFPNRWLCSRFSSPGTSRTDRIQKVQEYQATASIRRYVILEQDSVGATVFARGETAGTDSPWARATLLDLPEIGVSLTLADLYVDAGLEPETEAG